MCSENGCYALLSETVEELRELLKAILQQFLQIVEPLEAELLDLLYAKDVLTFSDYESVRETKPGYSRKDRVSVGQGLGFWSFPVPFFSLSFVAPSVWNSLPSEMYQHCSSSNFTPKPSCLPKLFTRI